MRAPSMTSRQAGRRSRPLFRASQKLEMKTKLISRFLNTRTGEPLSVSSFTPPPTPAEGKNGRSQHKKSIRSCRERNTQATSARCLPWRRTMHPNLGLKEWVVLLNGQEQPTPHNTAQHNPFLHRRNDTTARTLIQWRHSRPETPPREVYGRS